VRRAYLALGSNLGDSRAVMSRAVGKLASLGRVALRSSLYRTPPMGPPQPWYLNAAVALDASMAPEVLLETLKNIERE